MNESQAIARNGTQQYERLAAELSAEFVSIEERSVEQQLEFMRTLADHIRFFNLDNQADGDWSGLFESDLTDMLTFIDDPTGFEPDPESPVAEQRAQQRRFDQLAEPQRVLVYIFARMTQAIRSRFDQLTQRHLDFYYREVLQMTPSKGRADKVHLTCTLADGYDGTTLAKGTVVDAGTDAAGQPVTYAVDENYQINKAQIAEVKSLRVSRRYLSLNQIRKLYNNGFEVMLRWALGRYFQGDLLPTYPLGRYFDTSVDIDTLSELYGRFSAADAPEHDSESWQAYQYYLEVVLGFASVDDFHDCMAVYRQSIDQTKPYPDEAQWIAVADKIELAFDRRWQQKQMSRLLDIYRPGAADEQGRLQALFEYLFGDPMPGDPLPAMPTTRDTLESLYLLLSEPGHKGTDDYKLAARYMARLGLSVKDYLFIYRMHQHSQVLYKMPLPEVLSPEQPPQTSWYRFFYKLQRLEAQRRDKRAPKPGRWDVRNMLPSDNISLSGGVPAFGAVDNLRTPEQYYGPGLAVVSALLHLGEGERHIHLEVACKQKDFPMDDLLLAKATGKLNFDVKLSGQSGWQTLSTHNDNEKINFEISNIGDELVAAYEPEQLSLVVNLPDNTQDIFYNDYLVLEDGSIWQVGGFGESAAQLRLVYLSRIEGLSNRRNIRVPALDFVQEPTELTSLSYAPSKLQVSLEQQEQGYGATPEAVEPGDFVILSSALVLLIVELTDEGRKAKVEELGYLPEAVMKGIKGAGAQKSSFRLTSLALKAVSPVGEVQLQYLEGNPLDDHRIVFKPSDVSRLVQFANGYNLKIRHLVSPLDDTPDDDPEKTYAEALVEWQPMSAPRHFDTRVKKFSTYPGFVFDIHLASTEPPVTKPGVSEAVPGFAPIEPVLKLSLASLVDTDSADQSIDMAYEYFRDIRLHNVRLSVDVKGLDTMQLANDTSVLSAGQPFEPFGYAPYAGAALYFSHYELARKKLDSIALNLEWVDLPENLDNYYKAYRNAYPGQIPGLSNSAFQVGLSMFNQRSWIEQDQDKLLFNTDAADISHITFDQGFDHSAYDFLPDYPAQLPASPLEAGRYYKLSLQEPDFQHKIYPHVMRKLSLEAARTEGAELPLINEPYTPKVKSFSIDYRASEVITPSLYEQDEHSLLAHLHPFGAIDINLTINPDRARFGPMLLPEFEDEGYLYLGLSNARPLDELSILVQVMTGSGKAHLETPKLHWYYRTARGLTPLPAQNLLDDTTRSMSFSGLVRLRLPDDATLDGPLLPAGRHWLAVQVGQNADAAAKVIAFKTQSVAAVRTGVIAAGNPSILPAGSVTGLKRTNPAISGIKQLFDSYGGKAQANDTEFYRDVSERLRHRNRAVNLWDYERLALGMFPELRQVKCLCSAELQGGEPAEVSMMVVPELSSQKLDDVLAPAASADLLEQVRKQLGELASPDVRLTVKNPVFEPLKFRVAVRFNPGYGPGVYSPQVSEAIKSQLTPWAQSQAEPLQLGNRLYFSALINHLEQLPYVDYVAVFKGFRQVTLFEDSEEARTVWQPIDDKFVQVSRPDALLISDMTHRIDVISSEHFNPEDYMGVGYMVIELDNTVQ